jgi:hypothetical protein
VLEISKVLTLSTAHIRQLNVRWLEQWSKHDSNAPLIVYAKDGGWFIDTTAWSGYITPELRQLLSLARRHGCAWLVLDKDGPTVDNLPVFKWD